MPFLSLQFAAALACAVIAFHAMRPGLRRHYLLALSYAFYATWSVPYLALLVAATALVWFVGRRVAPGTESEGGDPGPGARRWFWASLVLLFGLLFALKYLPPLVPASSGFAAIAAPLGISYYTFRLTSYIIDVHWGKMRPERDLIAFALYVAFFPQIVSGPIQRADDFLSQIESRRSADAERIASGLRLILFGTFKKILVANRITGLVNVVFDFPGHVTGAAFLVASYAYAIQLYADFSGITDIAIGLGRLFGIESPPNFDNPFYSPNIQVFWQRWHMSLTSWIRDYLFASLHMSLRGLGNLGLVLAIMINMLAVGAWHGARWTYIVFGLINGVYVCVSALTLKRRNKMFRGRPLLSKARAVVGTLVTFHLVVFACVFVRAGSLHDAFYIVRHLVPSHTPGWGLVGIGREQIGVPGVLAIVAMEVVHLSRGSGHLRRALVWSPRWLRWSVYYAAAASILLFGQVGIQAFIYAGF